MHAVCIATGRGLAGRAGLLDELADIIIIITAAVAMCAITGSGAGEARSHFEQRLQRIIARTAGP